MKKSSFETFFEIFNCCLTCVYCDEIKITHDELEISLARTSGFFN